MSFDYSKLNGRIVECCKTKAAFAARMGLSERTISLKLSGDISWKQTEIQRAVEILDIPDNEIHLYFFTLVVQNL